MNPSFNSTSAHSVKLSNSSIINIVYVGEITEINLKLRCLEGMYTNVYHYESSIVAYHDLKHQKIKPDVLVCDANMIGINAIELYQLTKMLTHLNLVYVIITQYKFGNYYQERLKNLQINNILEYPIQLSSLSKKIKLFLHKENSQKMVFTPQRHSINLFTKTMNSFFSFFM